MSTQFVQAFIQNISFPTSLDELMEFAGTFNVEDILGVYQNAGTKDHPYCSNDGWTVPKWAKKGDIILFFHAKTANSRITRLVTELDRRKDEFDDETYWYLMNGLTRAKALWRTYGGKIFAIGRVAGHSYYDTEYEGDLHFRSHIFAPIDSIFTLEKPIDISEFNDRIMVSRQSSITPVFGENFDYIKELVVSKNRHVWPYFTESVSQPIPLSKVTRENWLQVTNPYRLSFILEAQFRAYYVDHLLKLIGDRKTFYSECCCYKAGCNPAWVDNVIRWNEGYLPIEVKLNVEIEKNIESQLDQYLRVDSIDLAKGLNVSGDELMPFVLAIDRERIYVYDGSLMHSVFSLDELHCLEDVSALRDYLKSQIPRLV